MREGLITNRGTAGDTYRAAGLFQGSGALGSESLVAARPNADVIEYRGSINDPDVLPLQLDNLIAGSPSIGYWDTSINTPDTSGALTTWEGSLYEAYTQWQNATAKHLQFAGSAGNLATIPDAAALDMTVVDIRCLISPTRWRTVAGTANQKIVSKRDATTGYELSIVDTAAGVGRLVFTTNNGTQSAQSAPIPFLNYHAAWVRVTHTSGSTKFYIAPQETASETEPTLWIKWGTTATNVVTAITANAVAFAIGAAPAGTNPFGGSVHVANVYNTVGGAYNSSAHIVNFEASRDLAPGSSPFTTPKPSIGGTWTVTLAGAATIELAGAGLGGNGGYQYIVDNTTRNWTYDIPPEEGGPQPEGAWVAWARIDTTTMGTIPDTGQILLMGLKDSINISALAAGTGLPGWGVYMKTDRTVWFEAYNGTITDTTATGSSIGGPSSCWLTAPTSADVLIVAFGNVDGFYGVRAYNLASGRTVTPPNGYVAWGDPSTLVDWMYTPKFKFNDTDSGVVPTSAVGYVRMPYTNFRDFDSFLSRIIDGVMDEGTYIEGDAYVSNTTGVFEGLILNDGDVVVADNTSDTPTWTKIERTVTPAWVQRSGDRDGGFTSGPQMLDPIVVGLDQDFTIWSVMTAHSGVATPLDYMQLWGFAGATLGGYMDSAVYENAGDTWFYTDIENDAATTFVSIDDIILAGDMNFQDCTEPHFMALTIDKANQEVTVWLDDNSFTAPIVDDGPITWDYVGDNGWANYATDFVPCLTLWGCGAGFRHYPPAAMNRLRESVLVYLRTRGGEPDEGFDGEFGTDPFGEGPFGG